jgi:hypothetical protein
MQKIGVERADDGSVTALIFQAPGGEIRAVR